MTRQEQIEQEAKTHSADVLDRHWFKRGAEWADQHPQWISIEDKMPNEKGRYIVHAERLIISNIVCEAFFDGKLWWHHSSGAILDVTHWMPLPASPATEGGAS